MVLWIVFSLTTSSTIGTTSTISLCGEQEKKQTGTLNGLFYLFYESTSKINDTPLIVWFSGGPGCSGLVGAFFENGPCLFNDETNQMSKNPFTWTQVGHVLYIDQPRGTGFSQHMDNHWSREQATKELAQFLTMFYDLNPFVKTKKLYLFGESYGGHFAPDLGYYLISADNKDKSDWQKRLKGIGIGDGIVSQRINLHSMLDYANENLYNFNFLPAQKSKFEIKLQHCDNYFQKYLNLKYPSSSFAMKGDTHVEVREACEEAEEIFLMSIIAQNKNIYDLRKTCHIDDPDQLCYRLSRLDTFVSQEKVIHDYLNVNSSSFTNKWSVCNSILMRTHPKTDKFNEHSLEAVENLLTHGIRVLVYAGDADPIVNWIGQLNWTKQLNWPWKKTYNQAFFQNWQLSVIDKSDKTKPKIIGKIKHTKELTFALIHDAGHVSV
jgi:carboxypeptidase C (cathepsin A)